MFRTIIRQLLKNRTKRAAVPTQRLHVVIKVLTVDQFPGGTEGIDHGGAQREAENSSKMTEGAAAVQGFPPPAVIILTLTSLCMWGGAAPSIPLAQEILVPRFHWLLNRGQRPVCGC